MSEPVSQQTDVIIGLLPTKYLDLEKMAAHHPIWQAAHLWLKNKTSERTRMAYLADLVLYQRWLYDHYQQTDLLSVTREQVLAWRDDMASHGKSPATMARRLAAVSAFYAEMMAELVDDQGRSVIVQNPADPKRVKRFKVSDESPRGALLNGAIHRLLSSPRRSSVVGARDYAILMLLVHMALRRAEIAGLLIGDIVEDGGYHTARVKGKGDKVRTLPIPAEAWEAIRLYLHSAGRVGAAVGQPLFVGTRTNQHPTHVGLALSPERVWQIVKHHATRAKIPLSTVTTHTLRHTAITKALEKKAPLHRVQYFAGHADPKTTIRYDHRRENLKESAVWSISYDDDDTA